MSIPENLKRLIDTRLYESPEKIEVVARKIVDELSEPDDIWDEDRRLWTMTDRELRD